MGVQKEEKIIKLALDANSLVSDYRKAIEEMRNAGGPERALGPMERALNRIDAELKGLQKQGQEGIIGDPKHIQRYDTDVQRVLTRLRNLGESINGLTRQGNRFVTDQTRQFEQLSRAAGEYARQTQQAFREELRNSGLGARQSRQIAEQVRNEQDLVNALEQELDLRTQNVARAKQAWDEQQRVLRANYLRKSGSSISLSSQTALGINATGRGYISDYVRAQNELAEQNGRRWELGRLQLSDGTYTGINPGPIRDAADYIQRINSEIADAVEKGRSFNQIWEIIQKRFAQITTQEILPNGTATNNLISHPLSAFFGNVDTLRNQVRVNTESYERTLNQNAFNQKFFNAVNSAQQIRDVYENVQLGQSNLLTSMNTLRSAEDAATNAENNYMTSIQRTHDRVNQLAQSTSSLSTSTIAYSNTVAQANNKVLQAVRSSQQLNSSFQRMTYTVLSLLSIDQVLRRVSSAIRQTYQDVKTLDKSFASIAMVTEKSVNEMWSSYGMYAEMAQSLGQTTDSVIEASVQYYQQGQPSY